jgi:hypothetical protein
MAQAPPTLIPAVAELAQALAWPLFALFVSVFYRKDLRDLSKRLRKGAGAEFDPLPQSAAAPSSILPAAPPTTAGASQLPATPTVLTYEKLILDLPPLRASTDPSEREAILVRLLARAALIARFEQIDGSIWKSQLDLLTYLNSKRPGESLSQLKIAFYDKAVEQHPDVYGNYLFEQWLGFLRGYLLVEVPGDVARITQDGIEYLTWRLEQARPPKIAG